jgi:NAD(P)-dependent dehydrogenase (short-subunit alcohol dehydrogenase family)
VAHSDLFALTGKRILITGATSGIGRETALQASRMGATVALTARRAEVLDEVLLSLDGAGHTAVPCDLTDTAAIPELVRTVADRLGGLDGLVHAAGVHSTVRLRDVQAGHVNELMNTNVTTAFMLAKGFRHKQVRGPSPSMVFLSSAAGLVGQPGVSVYAASKGAIVSFTKSLAMELAREGIRVNCVCPGVVETAMTDDLRVVIGETAFEQVRSLHPLGIGTALDVANSIVFLLSDASQWITGTALRVDGGYTAR